MRRLATRTDQGAVLPIVAVFTLVAAVFLAFVVDLGNQRQDRRQLTTATDAAALDVAQSWADNSLDPLASFTSINASSWDCSAAAQDYLDRNRTDDTGAYTCTAEILDGQLGSVSVFSDGDVDYSLGGITGQSSGSIGSTTSVRISSTIGGGLRPFAICAFDPDVAAWFAAGGSPSGQVLTLGGDKFLPPECGQNNGNWGFVSFPSQANGTPGVVDSLREGSTDPIASFNNGDADYDEEKQVCIDDDASGGFYDDQDPVTCLIDFNGTTWNAAGVQSALDDLRDSQLTFSLPVYGERADLGGSRTGFPVIGFAEVQLVSYDVQGANDNAMTLRFLRLTSGDCCEVNDSNQSLQLCDVGSNLGQVGTRFASACQTSDGSSGPGPSIPPAPDPCIINGTGVSPSSQGVEVEKPPASTGSTTEVVFTIDVADSTDCSGLVVEAVANKTFAATVTEVPTTGFEASFPVGTDFQKGKTYTIEVSLNGTLLDSTASLVVTQVP
ncbi:MAG: Tad domain-containing protein [Acidimicrobiales bacterium]|nr:Tad domain-containing protein [Acidimicrobiales bacterium]